ncbi:MAG: phytanoyl-CoA dioxygenase family protein [Rhodospirillales bacterium]|nr:phytanoyl-CoA dioxygenase family protein [Rhodospirillales bacterium]
MKLSDQQIDEMNNQGFLILPERFSVEEVEMIKSRLPRLFAEQHPANIVEQSSNVVRTSMGLHLRDQVIAKLVRHPRLIEPAQQIYPEPLYVQQVKVNMKAAFSGEVWQWHYDFATHREEDGVEKPLALNLHIFLDDVTEFNGPLYFIPKTHKYGEHQTSLDDLSTSYPLWVVGEDLVRKMAEQHGMVSATGKKGTALIFFDTLLHGSPNNMSPWDRSIFSLIVNPVSNALRHPTRPDFKHHQDLTAIEPLSDDCLMQAAL